MIEKKITICLNGKILFPIALNELDNLEVIRKKLEEDIQEDFLFSKGESKIKKKKEKKWSLKKLMITKNKESFIYLITNDSKQNLENTIQNISIENNKENNKNYTYNNNNLNGNNNENKIRNEKIKTEIIKRSQLIEKKGDLDIYLYPKIELREEEKLNESKVLLFCGQSGVGKTTFINAFLNIILGVSCDDKFRFKLIVEKQTENGQTESQTSEINFYYIEKTEIYPSFVIIDTPGIGDTKGKERDKEIIGKFEKTFKENKILKIHCICFLLKNDDNRAHEFINYM